MQRQIFFSRSGQRPVPDGEEPAWTYSIVFFQRVDRWWGEVSAITQITELLRRKQVVVAMLAPICETALHSTGPDGLALAVVAQWQHDGWREIRH